MSLVIIFIFLYKTNTKRSGDLLNVVENISINHVIYIHDDISLI